MRSVDLYQDTANHLVKSALIKATRDMAAFANQNPLDRVCYNVRRDAALYACLLLPCMIMEGVRQQDVHITVTCTKDEKDIVEALPFITTTLARFLHEEAPVMVVEPPVFDCSRTLGSPEQTFVAAIFRGARDYWQAQAECVEGALDGYDDKAHLPVYTNAMVSAHSVMDVFRKHEARDEVLRDTGIRGETLDLDYYRMAGILHGAKAEMQRMKLAGQ